MFAIGHVEIGFLKAWPMKKDGTVDSEKPCILELNLLASMNASYKR